MARKAKGRPVNGIILLDKPLGLSSNKALQIVKKQFRAAKAGHTGSLDPMATGMLPLCFGEATKIVPFMLEANKRYQVDVTLGKQTDTGDVEGEVVNELPVPDFSEEKLNAVLESFLGEQQQVPPMYSAVKVDGKRLYELARQGIEVERKSRLINVFELDLRNRKDNVLSLEVFCSKGTYIRTLAEDIGTALGTCAMVTKLHRTKVGVFDEQQMVPMTTIDEVREQGLEALDELLLPMDVALVDLPDVRLGDDSSHYVRMGQAVLVPSAPESGCVRLYDASDRFFGIGEINDDGCVAPKRLMNFTE